MEGAIRYLMLEYNVLCVLQKLQYYNNKHVFCFYIININHYHVCTSEDIKLSMTFNNIASLFYNDTDIKGHFGCL